MEDITILVVDDNPDILETLCFRLQLEDYQVIRASNGWEALGAVRSVEPDLVILDVILPKENGYRVSRFIKDDIKSGVYGKDIGIILMTGRPLDDADGMKKVVAFSQADAIMYKPFNMEELINNVAKHLRAIKEKAHG